MVISTDPRGILIVRPSALGDVCRTVPVLASLRRAFPDARIDWVVRDAFVEAIAAHPDLTEPIAFPRRRLARWWWNPAAARDAICWFSELRRRRYDLVFDLQGLGRSGLITRATAAPKRVGYRDAREMAWLGYNVRQEAGSGIHTVDEMLGLLEQSGIEPVRDMRLYAPPDAERWWVADRQCHGVGDAPYAVLAPTAKWPSKRWPIERWAAIIPAIVDRGFERIVIVGGPGESEQVVDLKNHDASSAGVMVDLVGRTSVGRMLAVIAKAGLVIAHDSAPLHMAVGFDRPCVALFGPTDPALVGPYRRPESVVQAAEAQRQLGPSYRSSRLGDELMRLITVEQVTERVGAVLETSRRIEPASTPATAREAAS